MLLLVHILRSNRSHEDLQENGCNVKLHVKWIWCVLSMYICFEGIEFYDTERSDFDRSLIDQSIRRQRCTCRIGWHFRLLQGSEDSMNPIIQCNVRAIFYWQASAISNATNEDLLNLNWIQSTTWYGLIYHRWSMRLQKQGRRFPESISITAKDYECETFLLRDIYKSNIIMIVYQVA